MKKTTTLNPLGARSNEQALPRSLLLWLQTLLVGVVALAPRCLGLNDFTTIDESYHWQGRVERFAEALRAGHWAATNQTGHPGVTTMWLGTLGRWLAQLMGVTDPGWAGGGVAYQALLRLPLAAVNGLAVVLGYLVLRRLVRPGIALLAALLWASSPFLIAHGRLLHLDALLTSFMTLSVLLLLLPNGGRWSIVASGVCAGLALLTKAPSLLLLPLAGGLMLLVSFRSEPAHPVRFTRANLVHMLRGRFWLALFKRYALWLGCAILVVFAAWPAMWVGPGAAIGSVLNEVIANGGEPHHSGNYFLGQPVADPGWLFYPAVVLWRSTPLMLIGLLTLPLAFYSTAGEQQQAEAPRADKRNVLFSLMIFVLFFGFMLSIEPKKFDRYLLPIWPAFEILAAAGLMGLVDLFAKILDAGSRRLNSTTLRIGMALLLGAFMLINLVCYQPYYLAYFNPLLGGGAMAERVMLVGWGEGMEQIGAWLDQRPDLRHGPVLSWIPPTLAPFIPKEVLVLDLRPQYAAQRSSYAVLYARSVQRKESAEAEAAVRQTPALFTLRMYGIEYATVHQPPRPFDQPVDAVFGEGLHLRGFSHELLGSTLVITPSWDIQTSQPGGHFSFVHLLDSEGRRVAQLDAPLDQGMFANWQAGQQFDNPLPLALPADLPSGEYQVVIGLYDPGNGARLPLAGRAALPEQIDGPHALLLTTLRLP